MDYINSKNILKRWDEGMAISTHERSLLRTFLIRKDGIQTRRQSLLCYAYVKGFINEDTFVERVADAWRKSCEVDIKMMSL